MLYPVKHTYSPRLERAMMEDKTDGSPVEDTAREIFPVRDFTPVVGSRRIADAPDISDFGIVDFRPNVQPADAEEEESGKKDPKGDTAQAPASSPDETLTTAQAKQETPAKKAASSAPSAARKPTNGSPTSSSAKKTG